MCSFVVVVVVFCFVLFLFFVCFFFRKIHNKRHVLVIVAYALSSNDFFAAAQLKICHQVWFAVALNPDKSCVQIGQFGGRW